MERLNHGGLIFRGSIREDHPFILLDAQSTLHSKRRMSEQWLHGLTVCLRGIPKFEYVFMTQVPSDGYSGHSRPKLGETAQPDCCILRGEWCLAAAYFFEIAMIARSEVKIYCKGCFIQGKVEEHETRQGNVSRSPRIMHPHWCGKMMGNQTNILCLEVVQNLRLAATKHQHRNMFFDAVLVIWDRRARKGKLLGDWWRWKSFASGWTWPSELMSKPCSRMLLQSRNIHNKMCPQL